MRKKLLGLLFTLMMTVPSQAQEPDTSEDMICTTHADIWSGTVDETRSIEANPVPDSFANTFNGGGCGSFTLVKTSILTWHRDFGNELTMRAGIEFLSADILKQLERPFSPDTPEDIEFHSKAYAKIANYYALGAEAHESVSLIDEAIAYYKKANALAQKISPKGSARIRLKSDTNEYFYYLAENPAEDLHLSLRQLSQDIYVMRAYITGDKEDIIFAENLLETHAPKFVKETLKAAEDSFEPICNTEDEKLRKKMKQACRKISGSYEDFVRDYLLKKILLATVIHGSSSSTYPRESNEALSGVGLLLQNSERQGIYPPFDQINPYNIPWFKALIANSDSYVKLGKKNSDDELIFRGLERLVYAERYMPRHASPSQWKKLAERFLEASVILDEILDEDFDEYAPQKWYRVRQHNQLTYFQNGLAALEHSQ